VYMFSIMYSNFSGSTLKLKSHIYSAEYLAWPHIIIGAYEHTWPTGSCAILTSLCIQSVVFFFIFQILLQIWLYFETKLGGNVYWIILLEVYQTF
jgi:hypothetical protein